MDPLELCRALIRCPSVTPEDAGAQEVLAEALEGLGFACHRLPFGEVANLYARIGARGPNFCFAGHTDVVPPGDGAAWSHPPFAAEVAGGRLYGRGAADMKGGIACFVAAAARFLAARGDDFAGSISLLITGDEEGPSVDGTAKVLDWLKGRGETLDACLVGEPTSERAFGDTVKIGRRGCLNGTLTVHGTQAHVAYPEQGDNPIPRLLAMLGALDGTPLDDGSEHFQPSNLEITTVDVGNPAANVIPAQASAGFNIRYNDRHHAEELEAWIRGHCDAVGGDYELQLTSTGDVFLTPPGRLGAAIAAAVETVTGRTPALGTGGGTSDARFIKDHCPVVEFGMIGDSCHKVDENVAVADLAALAEVYLALLEGFFGETPGC